MNKILNYVKINELISTSGQPKIEELESIANAVLAKRSSKVFGFFTLNSARHFSLLIFHF